MYVTQLIIFKKFYQIIPVHALADTMKGMELV